MATNPRARIARRRHLHERQAVVFGSIAAGLAVTTLAAAAIYTGTIDAPFLDRAFVTQTPTPKAGEQLTPVPCPPAGTLPVPVAAVSVTVYNASSRAGLAKTTADGLASRGFAVAGTGNYPTEITAPVEILFGADGVGVAYTLAAHLTDPRLVLDTRAGSAVDLVLGAEFGRLVPADEVALDPTVELTGVAGCVPLAEALVSAVPGPTPTDPATDPATDPEADPDADTDPNADPNADPDADPNAETDPGADPNADTGTDG